MARTKDRNKDIEYLRMACNMVELGINYQQADLIMRVQDRLRELNGNFTVEDGVEILHGWQMEWEKYFEAINNEKKTKSEQ